VRVSRGVWGSRRRPERLCAVLLYFTIMAPLSSGFVLVQFVSCVR